MSNDTNRTDGPRQDFTRRGMLMGAGLVAVAGAAFARVPVSHIPQLKKGALDGMIPKTVGPWTFEASSGLILPPQDELSDRLYDEIVTRVYVAPGLPPVMLLIAYSNTQDGLLQLHRPETCYPVGGFQLTETRIQPLELAKTLKVPARKFTASSPTRTEQVIYWTRVGPDVPTSWSEQRWSVVKSNLRGDIPDGILVRASVISPDEGESVGHVQTFFQMLAKVVDKKTAALLFGTA